jgi:hypothetical protein
MDASAPSDSENFSELLGKNEVADVVPKAKLQLGLEYENKL